MILLDGKAVSNKILAEMAKKIAQQCKVGYRPPGLAVILVGDDPASKVYVRNKQRACESIGIKSEPFLLPETTSQSKITEIISELNERNDIDGILLQLPLPSSLSANICLEMINPEKDVDGFHPQNVGKLVLDLDGFIPCTPAGILELLKAYDLSLENKKAVVIGRSNIVGKPLAILLARKNINATVTLCHSGTVNLKEECQRADFLFVAMGKPKSITADMVRENAVVVDIGINRLQNGLCGDVDFKNISPKVKAITPVPGGVGPLTIAMLLKNTIQSWQKRLELTFEN